jgi:hypothetical protein
MIEWSELDLHLDIEEMFSVNVGYIDQVA